MRGELFDLLPQILDRIEVRGIRGQLYFVQALGMGFVEEASRKIVDEPKDLVGFTYAAGRDCGLVALGGPGVAQGAPLGKTGLISKQQQRLALACLAEHRGPRVVAPLSTG